MLDAESDLLHRLHRTKLEMQNVFLLVGPSGSGKTNFIEKVTGKTGLRKASPATKVSELRVSLPEFPGTEICFIETPGFDDSEEIYIDIFKMISEWLKQLYNEGRNLTGLLYFHRISDEVSGTYYNSNLKDLRELHEDESGKLIFTTTMWDVVDMKRGLRREDELKEVYLESVLDRGASIQRFMNNRDSAIEILSLVMNRGSEPSGRLDLGYDVEEDIPAETRTAEDQGREERRVPGQEEYRPAERLPTTSNLSFSRSPATFTSVANNEFVPSSTPEPSSIVVPLHRLPETLNPEAEDSAPSAVPEPSSITVPLFRSPPSSPSEDDGFIPSAPPEPASIRVPLCRLRATSTTVGNDDSVPSIVPDPLSIKVPLSRSPATPTAADFVPSVTPEPSSIAVPLYRSPATSISAEEDDFVASTGL